MNIRLQFVAVACALTLSLMSCSSTESDSNDSTIATENSTVATQNGTVSEDKENQETYVIQGREFYPSLWAELSAKFGATNVARIMDHNGLSGGDFKAGRVILIPEGIELPTQE